MEDRNLATINSQMPGGVNFKLYWLLYPVFFALVYSFNFHALWLVYDLVAISLLCYYTFSNRKIISSLQRALIFLVFGYYSVLLVFNGMHLLMGFLSVWDTYKHLIFIVFAVRIFKYSNNENVLVFEKNMYQLIIITLIIQAVVVLIQFQSGVFFDSIAGTFGDGGSHAIGYFSLLSIMAAIAHRAKLTVIVSLLALTSLINILSENAGYFALLFFLVLGLTFSGALVSRIKPIHALYVIIFFIVLYGVSGTTLYSEKPLSEVVVVRLIDVVSGGTEGATGRGSIALLASSIGGWFGHGSGAFSDIYLMDGYDSYMVLGEQINISEYTHLLAETGMLGFILTLVIYLVFLTKLFKSLRYKLIAGSVFIACMFYSAVLMNESQFFMLLLLMFFLACHERNARFHQTVNILAWK